MTKVLIFSSKKPQHLGTPLKTSGKFQVKDCIKVYSEITHE